jgi:nucleoside-diphosphate-sugar epimerase
MKILLTGANGFLGAILQKELQDYNVITIGRNNTSIIADLTHNIRDKIPVCEIVIHAAGKAHMIPKLPQEEQLFFDVNVTGSANLISALEKSGIPKKFVFISSVAVYGRATGELIKETAPLEAKDAYGLSKIQAEKLIIDWCKKNKVICTILRLPLIAGPNPPGNLKSMINGIRKGYYFNIAGGKAKKSIVLAQDIAAIIPRAAQIGGIYNLTDRYHPSFIELSVLIAKQLNKKKPNNIPFLIAKMLAIVGDLMGNRSPITSDKLAKISSDLTFDDSNAQKLLGWDPTPVLEGFRIR